MACTKEKNKNQRQVTQCKGKQNKTKNHRANNATENSSRAGVPSVEELALEWDEYPKHSYDRLVARAAPGACSRSHRNALRRLKSVGQIEEGRAFTNSLITAWERFFVWHQWMEMGKESLSHSIASKLSQRGIFTLSPLSKFKHWTMARLKASKPRIQVLHIASGERHLLPESSPERLSLMPTFKKCELLSKATVFPVQWHIGRHYILPVTTNAAWEPPCEDLVWDSWKSVKKNPTAVHEFLKWYVPTGVLSMGILNEKPNFGETSWSTRHSNFGDETWETDLTRLSPCYVKQKCRLWGLRNSPSAVCTFCHGLWGQICSQRKCSQHGSMGVSQASGLYQMKTWLYFPLEITCAVTVGNVTCRNITMQKSHWFVWYKVTRNSPE